VCVKLWNRRTRTKKKGGGEERERERATWGATRRSESLPV
jgi:hypothetical protein